MLPISTGVTNERPVFSPKPNSVASHQELVIQHLASDTLLLTTQFSSGILRNITIEMENEVQIEGRVGLTRYFGAIAEHCEGQRKRLDIVDHSTVSNGKIDVGGLPFSPATLNEPYNRRMKEALHSAIDARAIREIRLLGCVTAVGPGASNVLALARLLDVPVLGTTIFLDETHFDGHGLKADMEHVVVVPGAAASSRNQEQIPAREADRATTIPHAISFVAHQWSQVATKVVPQEGISDFWGKVRSVRRSMHRLEKPVAVLRFEGAETLPPGYHVELLSDYRTVRYYVAENDGVHEYTGVVDDAARLGESVRRFDVADIKAIVASFG